MKLSRLLNIVILCYYIIFGLFSYLLLPEGLVIQIVDLLGMVLALYLLLRDGRLRYDGILLIYTLFFIVFLLSFIKNNTDIFYVFTVFRQYFICAVFYLILLSVKLKEKYYEDTLKILFSIAYIQLPLVIVQKIIYPFIPTVYKGNLFSVDYAAGTFGKGNPGVTACFLVLMLIIKMQECFKNGLSKKRLLQMIFIILPLGIVESDAQYVILPIAVAYLILLNVKISYKKIMKISILMAVMLIMVDYGLKKVGDGRGIWYRLNVKFSEAGIDRAYMHSQDKDYIMSGSGLRIEEMMYFALRPISFLGSGPGYWYEKIKQNEDKKMRLSSTVLMNYAEMGIAGVIVVLLFPIYTFLSAAKNNNLGKIVKVQSMYIFMLLFYHWPLYRFVLIFPYFLLWLYYKKLAIRNFT